jgi:hypothetical protein
MPARIPPAYFRSVFINCPFDGGYLPLLHALIFGVIDCGFVPRCALEAEDSGDVRIQKIMQLIEECCYGVHDISRTETTSFTRPDNSPELLPRFNMPLELGIFIGAQRFGNGHQKRKKYLVFDTEPYRFQKFISDLAGQDIKTHGWPGTTAEEGKRDAAIRKTLIGLHNWLITKTENNSLPSLKSLQNRFFQFRQQLPQLAVALGQHETDISFYNLSALIETWLRANPPD